jgi:hypothetical protein
MAGWKEFYCKVMLLALEEAVSSIHQEMAASKLSADCSSQMRVLTNICMKMAVYARFCPIL